jgi:formimidoylglutamate deiminase
MMPQREIIEADWTWTGTSFERHVQVVVAPDGSIGHVGALSERPTHRLQGRALLPGMINVHSHAFQRGLRGLGERFPAGTGSFWTWREEMYRLVSTMTAERLYDLSRRAFTEMLAAGITTVGEFHYLHHDASCDGFAFDEIILRAAADAGIRLVLLNSYYRTGDVGRRLEGAQRQFDTPSVSVFWRQTDRLAGMLDARTQSMGVAPHSVRAVPIEDIVEIHAEAVRRGMVCHMHVEEVRGEIESCRRAHYMTPMALLTGRLRIGPEFTAVHCTHTEPGDMRRFTEAGGHVCLCPITEGNLGDGIADVPGIRRLGGRICIGTDLNSRLDMAEELRWLEYVQRVRGERRGLVVTGSGDLGPALFACATTAGATSLGLRAGVIEPGAMADFFTVDLTHATLAGWTPETLLDSFILGGSVGAIDSVCVGGAWTTLRQRDGH